MRVAGKYAGRLRGVPGPGGSTPSSPTMDSKKYYTRGEVADMAGVTPATVSKWIGRGILKGVRISHIWHVDKACVDSQLETLTNIGASENRAASLEKELDVLVRERRERIAGLRADNEYLTNVPSFVELIRSFVSVMCGEGGISETGWFVLRSYVNNMSTADIAAHLGVSSARVRQILYAVMGRLSRVTDYKTLRGRVAECERQIEERDIQIASLKKVISMYERRRKTPLPGSEEVTVAKFLLTPIEDLDLSVRSINGLRGRVFFGGRIRHPKTLAHVVQLSRTGVLGMRNIGKRSLYEICGFLESLGLDFGMGVEDLVAWSRNAEELVNVNMVDIDFQLV